LASPSVTACAEAKQPLLVVEEATDVSTQEKKEMEEPTSPSLIEGIEAKQPLVVAQGAVDTPAGDQTETEEPTNCSAVASVETKEPLVVQVVATSPGDLVLEGAGKEIFEVEAEAAPGEQNVEGAQGEAAVVAKDSRVEVS
jgi:hypothetical protein